MTSYVTREMVNVWGKDYETTVYQKSKSVWHAVGEYMGEQIDVKGSSQRGAVSQWREAARYKGNIGVGPA